MSGKLKINLRAGRVHGAKIMHALTLDQAAELVHCSAESLRLAIADGRLVAYKPPSHRCFLVYLEDLDVYIRAYPVKKCDSTNAVKSGGVTTANRAVEEALRPRKREKPRAAPAIKPPESGTPLTLAYSTSSGQPR
mgnify:CR=1 FL=1